MTQHVRFKPPMADLLILGFVVSRASASSTQLITDAAAGDKSHAAVMMVDCHDDLLMMARLMLSMNLVMSTVYNGHHHCKNTYR